MFGDLIGTVTLAVFMGLFAGALIYDVICDVIAALRERRRK